VRTQWRYQIVKHASPQLAIEMTAISPFPAPQDGLFYLTEGGIETEIMYKRGFPLPQFAMYPLLESPKAMAAVRAMYREYLDVAAKHRMAALMGGLDYRASPDWGALLGYSAAGLAEANLRSIAFLRDLAAEYATALPAVLVQGFVGPRGDAYQLNRTITETEAEEYHAVQLATLRQARVDLAWAFTINNVPEAVGIARAAAALGVPLAISFIVEPGGRLKSGPRLADAITTIDAATSAYPTFYSVNCAHPEEFEPAFEPGPWIHRIRGLRPNASRMEKVALCQLGHLEEGDPSELGQLMGRLAARLPSVDIWGGCCGTGAVHLDAIATRVLATRERTSRAPHN